MAIHKKATSLPPELLAAAKERSAQARRRIVEVGRDNLLTPEEKANAAPFYFVLRNYIRQLKAAREAAGLTLTEVAARSGLALESLSRLETGAQTNPTWRTLGLYAVAIGCAPCMTVESIAQPTADPNAVPQGGAAAPAGHSEAPKPVTRQNATPDALRATAPDAPPEPAAP
jgi:transcriptional regulator with XRE-family HTH domain